MTSKPKGKIVVPVWSDDDVVKPLVDDDGRIPVVVETVTPAIDSQVYGWDGSLWHKLPMLFGYSDRWADIADGEASGSGNAVASSTPVVEGYIYVCQGASGYHNAGVNKTVTIQASGGGFTCPFTMEASQQSGVWFTWSGQILLKYGDVVQAVASVPGDGKSVYLRVWGYKMKIAE